MPSAQHPALHNSPASHVAVGMSVRMSAPGLFMRKLPLGRAQVTGYTTPQTDFCSLVLLPLLFLSPGCGSLEPVERSWLGGLSPASSSEGTGPCHSQCCSPACPAQAPPLRESLFSDWHSRFDAIPYPTHLLSLCVWAWTNAMQGHFIFLFPLEAQPVWKFLLASLMATSSCRVSPATRAVL